MNQPAYLALGANIDNPAAQLSRAIAALAAEPDIDLIAVSPWYRSSPVGYLDQPDFINAVAEITTTLTAEALLSRLLALETAAGRRREVVNGPRCLDLDLLLFGCPWQHWQSPQLTLPHPRMHSRAFVLQPLLDLAGELVLPGHGSIRQLLAAASADGSLTLIKAAAKRPFSDAGFDGDGEIG